MEVLTVVDNIYALPVSLVVVLAALVFVIGFRGEKEPSLEQLALVTKSKVSEDKKVKKKKKETKPSVSIFN